MFLNGLLVNVYTLVPIAIADRTFKFVPACLVSVPNAATAPLPAVTLVVKVVIVPLLVNCTRLLKRMAPLLVMFRRFGKLFRHTRVGLLMFSSPSAEPMP